MRNPGQRLQNENVLPTVGFEPGSFRLRIERDNHCATRSDIYRNDSVLPACAIKIYLYYVVDVIKCFDVYYILLAVYSQQMS